MVVSSVLLYLAMNDVITYDVRPRMLSVDLLDIDNSTHPLVEATDIQVDCSSHPYVINLQQDLSKPFLMIKGNKFIYSFIHSLD